MSTTMVDGHPVPAQDETGPYVLLVTLRAMPERADALQARLIQQIEPTRAEPGNVTYTLYRDRLDPSTFYFYESYSDLDAFRTHLGSPPVAKLGGELGDYLNGDFRMTYLSELA